MARKTTQKVQGPPRVTSKQESEIQTLDSLKAAFSDLPERRAGIEKMTTKEIVANIKPTLATAREKNYSWEEIRDLFNQLTGRDVSVITLKSYMQENRTPAGAKFGPRKTSSETAAQAAPQSAAQSQPHQTTVRGRADRKNAVKVGATSKKASNRRASQPNSRPA